VTLHDFTTHWSGPMTAGPANGFGHVLYQPTSTTCNVAPYAFRPMYSTSGLATRMPWTAHTDNVAFADEIGHFECCRTVDTTRATARHQASTTQAGSTPMTWAASRHPTACWCR